MCLELILSTSCTRVWHFTNWANRYCFFQCHLLKKMKRYCRHSIVILRIIQWCSPDVWLADFIFCETWFWEIYVIHDLKVLRDPSRTLIIDQYSWFYKSVLNVFESRILLRVIESDLVMRCFVRILDLAFHVVKVMLDRDYTVYHIYWPNYFEFSSAECAIFLRKCAHSSRCWSMCCSSHCILGCAVQMLSQKEIKESSLLWKGTSSCW